MICKNRKCHKSALVLYPGELCPECFGKTLAGKAMKKAVESADRRRLRARMKKLRKEGKA